MFRPCLISCFAILAFANVASGGSMLLTQPVAAQSNASSVNPASAGTKPQIEPGIAKRQFELGLEHLRTGRPDLAEKIWTRLADAGSSEAQYSLALLLETGQGQVSRDPVRAVGYYQLAADAGIPEAQTNLGLLLAQGIGTDANPELAVKYWKKSASAGHAMALFNLGLAYYQGTGTPIDESEAVALIYRAGMQNLKDAQYALGQFYSAGVGVPKSEEEALYWYRLAGRQGHAEALERAKVLQGAGVALQGAPDPSLKPREAKIFAANPRVGVGALETAVFAKQSKPTQPDQSTLANQATPAPAKAEISPAVSDQTQTRKSRSSNQAPRKRSENPIMMLSQSEAQIVYREALVILQSRDGDRLRNGREAASRILSAAIAGNAKAQRSLGEMYLLGVDIERDETQSLFWIREAERNGIEDINGFATALEMQGFSEPSQPEESPEFLN